jgi:hypothetical protein
VDDDDAVHEHGRVLWGMDPVHVLTWGMGWVCRSRVARFMEQQIKQHSSLLKAADSGLGKISYDDVAHDLLRMKEGLRSAGGERPSEKTHLRLNLFDWRWENVGGEEFLKSGDSRAFVPWLCQTEVRFGKLTSTPCRVVVPIDGLMGIRSGYHRR